MSLHLGNLSPHVREDELDHVFRRFGDCTVQVKDKFGFVIYQNHANADRALRAFRGKAICGERIFVSWSKRQPRRLQQRRFDDVRVGHSGFSRKRNYGRENVADHRLDKNVEDGDRRHRAQEDRGGGRVYSTEPVKEHEAGCNLPEEDDIAEANIPESDNRTDIGQDFDRYEPYIGEGKEQDELNSREIRTPKTQRMNDHQEMKGREDRSSKRHNPKKVRVPVSRRSGYTALRSHSRSRSRRSRSRSISIPSRKRSSSSRSSSTSAHPNSTELKSISALRSTSRTSLSVSPDRPLPSSSNELVLGQPLLNSFSSQFKEANAGSCNANVEILTAGNDNHEKGIVSPQRLQETADFKCEDIGFVTENELVSRDTIMRNVSAREIRMIFNTYCLMHTTKNEKDSSLENDFGSARLWPWEIVYYRRLKKGPISTDNYARRLAQNKEFGIVDKYIRSSSGWKEQTHEYP